MPKLTTHIPEYVRIMDTTLRDGEQTSGVSFYPREKYHLARLLLSKLNVDRIEIASARVSAGEQEAVAQVTEWAYSEDCEGDCLHRVEVLGFVDGTKSVDWICGAGGRVLNLLTKGSEKHCTTQLGKTLSEHLADIRETVAYAKEQGVTVNVYLEDFSNGYADSPAYVYELMDGLSELGLGRVMLPDTLGAMMPGEVFTAMRDMLTRFPWAKLDFHPHNDYGLATANALAAVQAGVDCIHATVNCLGERAGNASIAEVAVVLKDKLSVPLSIDELFLWKASELVSEFAGKRLAMNAPIVGADVFTQASGIHADGDRKGGLYENKIKPERFGRSRDYALGKMSGKSSIIKNLESLGIHLSAENLAKVVSRVVELGDRKQDIQPTDLPFIISDVLDAGGQERVHLTNCTIASGLRLRASASLRLDIDGEEHLATGEGDGGYDAFMQAIKKILKKKKLPEPKLLDYEIRIPRGGQTSAITKAIITWEGGGRFGRQKTVGVDSDQVMAAVRATIKKVNLDLMVASIAPLAAKLNGEG